MEIRKTFKFMFQNPSSIFLYFFLCWFLFSGGSTLFDDPFKYGTLPDVVEKVKQSGDNLPWSLWKLCTALSLVIEEIVGGLFDVVFIYIITTSILLCYLEARGKIKGSEYERQSWMEWFNKKHQNGLDETFLNSKDRQNSTQLDRTKENREYVLRSPIRLALHFPIWYVVINFIALTLALISSGNAFSLQELFSLLQLSIIPAILFSLISCYLEVKGFLKGVAAEKRVWIDWYNSHKDTITDDQNSIEPPTSENIRFESYFMNFAKPIGLMLRDPKPIFVHFVSWILGLTFLIFFTYGILTGDILNSSVRDIPFVMMNFTVPAILFAIVISFHFAKGQHIGMVLEQQNWDSWYTEHRKLPDHTPSEENLQSNSYFKETTKLLSMTLRKPKQLLTHLICWIFGFVIVYGITDHLAIERLPDLAQMLLTSIGAIVTCYQEMKGGLKGSDTQRRIWMKWFDRQRKIIDGEINLTESPPMLT